jgi:hypothetical protein
MMPTINSYLKDGNMVDGQTDRLAWQFVLHREEITANPFESSSSSSNSTETIANTTTTMGQTKVGTENNTVSTKQNDSISFKTTLQARPFSGTTLDVSLKSNFTFGSASPICPSNDCKQELVDAFYSESPDSPSVTGTLKIENKTTSTPDMYLVSTTT